LPSLLLQKRLPAFPLYDPSILRNVSGAALDLGGGFVIPTDALDMTPGQPNNVDIPDPVVVLRFTAPSAAFYQFDGLFEGLQNGSSGHTATEGSINLNLAAPFFPGTSIAKEPPSTHPRFPSGWCSVAAIRSIFESIRASRGRAGRFATSSAATPDSG